MSETFDITDNVDRLQLLKDIAAVYTSSGYYRWEDIYVLMPKYSDDPEGINYLAFLEAFQYWILIPRVSPIEDPAYFCELAEALMHGRAVGGHKLPLGNIPELFSKHCSNYSDKHEEVDNG